jgi:hypothetical protein
MIANGGLLILFDGLNEVGEATRQKVARFVDANWQDNWIVAASQQIFLEFKEWPKRVELAPLNADKIARIIRQTLPADRAEDMIACLTLDHATLFARPQDLKMVLNLVERHPGMELPASREELYAAAFRIKFQEWRNSGKADFPDILAERAYIMLRERDANLLGKSASVGTELPLEVRNFLVEERFAVQQDGTMFFVHDLVRAYLASLHFAPNWRELLNADREKAEANWLSMFQFTLRRMVRKLSGNEVRAEALALSNHLLEVNDFLAGLVVGWIERELPETCADWKDDFYRRYGERRVRGSLALME